MRAEELVQVESFEVLRNSAENLLLEARWAESSLRGTFQHC